MRKHGKELFTTITIRQPVYGFYSVIYLAETAVCIPLHDLHGTFADLKRKVAEYPSALRKRIVADSLWSEIHTEPMPHKFAAQEDTYNMSVALPVWPEP